MLAAMLTVREAAADGPRAGGARAPSTCGLHMCTGEMGVFQQGRGWRRPMWGPPILLYDMMMEQAWQLHATDNRMTRKHRQEA